jgi:hypothetical protein
MIQYGSSRPTASSSSSEHGRRAHSRSRQHHKRKDKMGLGGLMDDDRCYRTKQAIKGGGLLRSKKGPSSFLSVKILATVWTA